MEAKHYARIRQAAITKAGSKGFASDGEDFAQVAATKIANGRKANIAQLFIDYLRETYGNNSNNRTAEARARQALAYTEQRAYVEVSAMADSLEGETTNTDIDFHKIISAMGKRERADLILLFKWGFTYKELGELHGVSESQAFLDMKETLNTLRKRILNARLKDPVSHEVTP